MPGIDRWMLAILVLAAAFGAASGGVRAQEDAYGASFITPFPEGDVYKVVIIGDDLAEGLLEGMTEAFLGDTRVQLRPRRLPVNGLMRADFDDKLKDVDAEIGKDTPHIAIVMLGAWDRVTIRDQSGKRVAIGSDAWRAAYTQRVDRMAKTLRKRNIGAYWVGLPNVRRYEANEDAQMMNEIIRERSYLNSMKFIDSYAGFVDESGGFSPYGPDITGKIRLLRDGEGVYFTTAGNRKLAHFVERDVRRDLNQAKAARTIPLAGSEAEQAKINPDKVKLAVPVPGTAEVKSGQPAAQAGAPQAHPATGQATGEQKADNGRISLKTVNQAGREEVVTLDIVRPAISASVVQLVTRRESPDRPSQIGEAVVDQIAGGLTVMSTVALASAPGPGGARRGLATVQTPYYRVLFKGERLTPRSGRADDLPWPRPEPTAVLDTVIDETGALPAGGPEEKKPQQKAPAARK